MPLPSEVIVREARAAGFHLVGVAPAERLDGGPLERWLAQGMAGSMLSWMSQRHEARLDPRQLLAGARTVVALGCCLRTHQHLTTSPIALYAQGRDYHATLRDRLRALRRRLEMHFPGLSGYAEADTGPVMEKVWAQRAGLGWIGRNGMLVTPGHGSHVLLAVMLLDASADRHDAPHPDRCGRCSACLDGCPTRAIVAPGIVDSRLCLSYQTIEEHGGYSELLRPHARLAFGCDACQQVCPWNQREHACGDPRFEPRPIASLTLLELATLSAERFVELTRGTAVARARHAGLRRNAIIALGARDDPAVLQAHSLLDDVDPTVRDAARWAMARVGAR